MTQNASTPTNENYLYDDKDVDGISDEIYKIPSGDIKATLPEQQAKEEEQRKAMQIQREFEAQFDKAMEKVKANHHKESGGIKGLDAREAFELYKQAAIIKEESARKVTPPPNEASWHKRYFGRKKVEDNDVTVENKESMSPTGQEVQSTTNNDSPEHDLVTEHHQDLQLDQAPKAKEIPYRKNDKNLTEKMEIPAVEEKETLSQRIKFVQNGVINRLEMIVRGLEAQLH